MLQDYLFELIPETLFADKPELLVLALLVLMIIFFVFVWNVLYSFIKAVMG